MSNHQRADVSWNDPGRDLEIDGVSLHIAVAGDGKPLLLIMGIGGHVDMWRPLVQRLVQTGIAPVAYDHPGTGMSSSYRLPRRVSGFARTLEHLLDALDHDQVDVLGVSFGGGVAQQFAHDFPERVRRLILCATSSGMVSMPGSPRALLALATPRRFTDPGYFVKIAPAVFGGKSREDPELLNHAGARFAHPPTPRGYGEQLLSVAGWTSFRWLPQLQMPTLVLHGDDDPVVPLINGRLLAKRIPNSRLEIVRGGGHLFLLDQVDEASLAISEFLSEE